MYAGNLQSGRVGTQVDVKGKGVDSGNKAGSGDEAIANHLD
jgi:hypothetical protein